MTPRRPKGTKPSPPPKPPAVPVERPWEEIRTAFVVGEETQDRDAASDVPLRVWPSFGALARRFSVPQEELEARARVDGWFARRDQFKLECDRARERKIAERIASNDMPARLAYLGIHNDIIRGLGRILEESVPKNKPAGQKGCSLLPRDLKVLADTTVSCSEVMAAAQGRRRGSESPFSLSVLVAQAQALQLPVPGVAPALQASLVAAPPAPAPSSDGPQIPQGSIWSLLLDAQRAPLPPAVAEADPYDMPSTLPAHLSSVR